MTLSKIRSHFEFPQAVLRLCWCQGMRSRRSRVVVSPTPRTFQPGGRFQISANSPVLSHSRNRSCWQHKLIQKFSFIYNLQSFAQSVAREGGANGPGYPRQPRLCTERTPPLIPQAVQRNQVKTVSNIGVVDGEFRDERV